MAVRWAFRLGGWQPLPRSDSTPSGAPSAPGAQAPTALAAPDGVCPALILTNCPSAVSGPR